MPSSAHERIIDDLCKNQGFKMISGEIAIETCDPEEYIEKLKSGHRVAITLDGKGAGFMRVASIEREEFGFSYMPISSGVTYKTKPQSRFIVTLTSS